MKIFFVYMPNFLRKKRNFMIYKKYKYIFFEQKGILYKMKRLKNKLNKKSYSLFNKIDKIVRFESFLNNESFEYKKKYIEESFILENPNKTFKLTQKTVNAIYQDLIIENLQNQVKFFKGDIYLITDYWRKIGKLNINEFALVIESFTNYRLTFKNALSIMKDIVLILTIDDLDSEVIQLKEHYIRKGIIYVGKYLDSIPRFTIDKIYTNKKINRLDFINIDNELIKLCDGDIEKKEFLIENLATIFITDFKIKKSFNSFIKINNNFTFLKILSKTFDDSNFINLKDIKPHTKEDDYLSILYSSIIVAETKKYTKEVINISKKYENFDLDIKESEYFAFFNFLINKAMQILQREPIHLIYKENKKVDTKNEIKDYLLERKDDILYYSVKKVRDDYEKFCIENNLKPLSKTDFNDSIANILSLKQATTWSSILKDIPKLQTKRTYAWLPK